MSWARLTSWPPLAYWIALGLAAWIADLGSRWSAEAAEPATAASSPLSARSMEVLGPPSSLPARGGGTGADFESLIELITSTVRPTTWDKVGGPGAISPFPTGVYADPQGVLDRLLRAESVGPLAALYASASPRASQTNPRRVAPLRKVSLPRLEKAVEACLAAGRPLTEEMQSLAGLQRVRYVLAYPESGDLVLAGPAGPWPRASQGRLVGNDGQPVLHLDDLVVLWRLMFGQASRFGCAITPRQEALARLQEYLEQTGRRSLRPQDRRAWGDGLRASVGKQDVQVYGLDRQTRAARILVEADYHMKLVGMGLEEGVPGVESYLDLVKIPPGGSPPPMTVLRWWFTLNYDRVQTSPDRRAFALCGQGAQVLSENELLAAHGTRVHTGQSDDLNRQFAQSFTDQFPALCKKYPIYAELRNIFDLALAGALIRAERLNSQVGWRMGFLGDPAAYRVEPDEAPTEVDSVINHRVVRQVHVLAGVSGGVGADPSPWVAYKAIAVDPERRPAQRDPPGPPLAPDAWWWD